MKNKKAKQMMADIFNGKWERLDSKVYVLVVLEGHFGSFPVHCSLHGVKSLTADQLKEVK